MSHLKIINAGQGYIHKHENCSTMATGSSNGWLGPDALDAVIWVPDDGRRNHPKYVEQFTDKIYCVQLHFVGHLLK